jgi:tRNA threonylcarbamoyladenosine biosynthesis protein TsaE
MEILVNHSSELADVIPAILDVLGSRRKIALYGQMGAGKTTFVKAFCRHLGVEENGASPSFSLINEYSYQEPEGGLALVHHLDLYRLKTLEEAIDIGIEEVLYDPWYCFIEWPQLAEPVLPEDTVKIQIDILGETQRRLLIL